LTFELAPAGSICAAPATSSNLNFGSGSFPAASTPATAGSRCSLAAGSAGGRTSARTGAARAPADWRAAPASFACFCCRETRVAPTSAAWESTASAAESHLCSAKTPFLPRRTATSNTAAASGSRIGAAAFAVGAGIGYSSCLSGCAGPSHLSCHCRGHCRAGTARLMRACRAC